MKVRAFIGALLAILWTAGVGVTQTGPAASNPATQASRPTSAASFVLRLNCAGKEYKDARGNIWQADHEYVRGGWGYVQGGEIDRGNIPIANTDMAPLFQTERFSVEAYRFRTPENGKYTLALLFAETFQNKPGEREFNISIQGKPFLKNFDVVKESGGKQTAVAKVAEVDVTDYKILVEFEAVKQAPIINAIVLMSGSGADVVKAATAGVGK